MRRWSWVLVLGLVAVSASCSDGSGGSDGEPRRTTTSAAGPELVELTQGDGCGEAFFWAATADGDTAVVVSIEANFRSKEETTTVPFDIPDDLVTVEVREGRDLTRNFCTDLISGESEPTSRTDAVAGTGEIVLAPPLEQGEYGCGSSDQSPNGTLHFTGVEARDGTRFAPIDVETEHIGCYSG